MNLDEFANLDKETAVNYDFKKIIFNARHIPYQNEILLNFILYKGNGGFFNDDCDRLPLALEIYKCLWGTKYKLWSDSTQIDFVPENGETMNSFVTSYKSIHTNCYVYNKPLIEKFSILTHTLGNFLPVYVELKSGNKHWVSPFNAPRYNFTLDYWDTTLKDIKNYYDKNNPPQYILNSKAWLDSFTNWEGFVTSNFLEDFLINDKDPTSEPVEFWEGHFTKRKTRPNNIQLYKFLNFVNHAITARGNRMYDALQQNLAIK